MAEKRPLCLYSGKVKRLQPGDTLLGAYNATEAGWIVNASAYLVATPGSTKISGKVVTGSIWAINSTGLVMRSPLAGPVLRWDNDGQVIVGSAADAADRLHVQEKGSGGVVTRYTNDTTGHTSADGTAFGIDGSEQAYVWNYENSKLYFGTNNIHRMSILAGGNASINNALILGGAFAGRSTASIDSTLTVGSTVVLRGNASIDGNLVVGGTGAFSNAVTITADVQVEAGQKFYMDGGTDTYWTASNDIITGHVDSASIIRFHSNKMHLAGAASIDTTLTTGGHAVMPSANITALNVTTATLPTVNGDTDFQGAIIGRTTASIDTNANIGGNLYVGGDLTVVGTMVVTATTHYLGDNILGDNAGDTQRFIGDITASGPMIFNSVISCAGNATIGNIRVPLNGKITLGSGGYHADRPLYVYDDAISIVAMFQSGTSVAGIAVRDIDTTSEYNNRLYCTGDTVSLMAGGTDALTMTSAKQTVSGAFVGRSTASIDGALTAGAALTVVGHTSGPSIQMTSLDSTTATITTLGVTTANITNANITTVDAVNASLSGNASIDGTLAVGGAVTLVSHMSGPSGQLTSFDSTNATIGTLGVTALTSVTLGLSGKLTSTASIQGDEYKLTAGGRMAPCTITASGDISGYAGSDVMFNKFNDTSPDVEVIAEKIWNAVYNDVVDWQDLAEDSEAIYGKVYVDSYDGARIPTSRCQKSVIGICSDTFGFAVGRIQGRKQIPVSVAGWALAYVDRAYESGEPLTNTSSGCLTCMTATEKREFPERLVAIYKRPETASVWQDRVEVKGRHWVRVK